MPTHKLGPFILFTHLLQRGGIENVHKIYPIQPLTLR